MQSWQAVTALTRRLYVVWQPPGRTWPKGWIETFTKERSALARIRALREVGVEAELHTYDREEAADE